MGGAGVMYVTRGPRYGTRGVQRYTTRATGLLHKCDHILRTFLHVAKTPTIYNIVGRWRAGSPRVSFTRNSSAAPVPTAASTGPIIIDKLLERILLSRPACHERNIYPRKRDVDDIVYDMFRISRIWPRSCIYVCFGNKRHELFCYCKNNSVVVWKQCYNNIQLFRGTEHDLTIQ